MIQQIKGVAGILNITEQENLIFYPPRDFIKLQFEILEM